jgi:hypothetical protein
MSLAREGLMALLFKLSLPLPEHLDMDIETAGSLIPSLALRSPESNGLAVELGGRRLALVRPHPAPPILRISRLSRCPDTLNHNILQMANGEPDVSASATTYAESVPEWGLPTVHTQLLQELRVWIETVLDLRRQPGWRSSVS